MLPGVGWHVVIDLDGEELQPYLQFDFLDIVLHENGKQEAELLIHHEILAFAFLSKEVLELLFSNFYFVKSSNQNYISQIIWQIQKRMPQVLIRTLCVLNPNLARINQTLDLLNVVHHKVAVHFLNKNGLHHDRLQLVQKHLTHRIHVGFSTKNAQLCIVLHSKNLIDQQLSVVVEINIVPLVHSEVLEGSLLVAYEFTDEIFRDLNPVNLKLIERVFNSVTRVQ